MWLGILKALLSVAAGLADYLRDRQLLEAGEAMAIAKGLRESLDAIDKANKARQAANDKPLDNNGDWVSDDDGFKRD